MADHAFLIVEDDVHAARAFARLVRPHAHAAVVGTIADAERVLGARVWTGIVIDVGLPDGDGLDLLSRVRARYRTMPAIVATGSADQCVANRAYQLGAGCVFKPDIPLCLLRFVRCAIAARSSAEARTIAAVGELRSSLKLSPREAQIAKLIALGVTRSRLRHEVGVTENTIKTEVKALLRKFDEKRIEGVARAVLEETVRLSSMDAAI